MVDPTMVPVGPVVLPEGAGIPSAKTEQLPVDRRWLNRRRFTMALAPTVQ